MRDDRTGKRRKLSAGTVFMLVMLAAVILGSAAVLTRLSSGASVDLSKLHVSVLNLQGDPAGDTEEKPQTEPKQDAQSGQQAATQSPAPTAEPQTGKASFTLTAAGSICLSGEVRKNSKSTDAKVEDYADIMMLLAPKIRSDVNAVFLENILSDRYKISDIVAPASAVSLLDEAGFDTAACGYAQAYAQGKDGVGDTLTILDSHGINALGLRYADDPGKPAIRNVKGIRTAFLQFTANMSAKARKSMEKDGAQDAVPEADLTGISAEISAAREAGAEAVIVFISWGKNGKEPDREQKELAAGIALAGADLIIGNGSHVPQTAEYLSGQNDKPVLCVWSLGTLLSGDRSNVKRVSGYLLHVTVARNESGVTVVNPEYTPVYTWKYRQDSRYYYRCIASGGDAPDGMDSDERKTMKKSAETVASVLADSPLTGR